MDLISTIVYILYFSGILSIVSSQRIPSPCYGSCLCSTNLADDRGLTVNCKWSHIASETRQFAHIPKNSTRSLSIECTSDRISEFSDFSFIEFENLLNLRIENCQSRSLPPNLFRGLKNLRSLYLIELGIPKLSLTLSRGIFDDFERLEKLYIVDSHIEAFPNEAFCKTKRLQVLNVSSNWFTSISAVLRSSNCLPEVLIIVDLSNNRISSIQFNDFKSLTAIRQLLLANNRIDNVDNGSFKALKYLRQLYIQNNNISRIGYLPDSLLDLNVANNRLTSIPESILFLQNLESLDLSGNIIDENASRELQSLKLQILDLSHNNFSDFPGLLLQNVLPNLTEFSIAFNRIAKLPKQAFTNAKKLEKLDLSHNLLGDIGSETFNAAKLNYLNFSHNSLKTILSEVTVEASSLLNLDLSYNEFYEVPSIIRKLIILQNLDLSHNQIKDVSKFLFNNLASLQSIDMSYNKLTKVDSYVFQDSRRLNRLLLSHNSIGKLTADAFAKCPEMEYLDLSSNRITNTNGSLSNVNSLITVNLSQNLLPVLEWAELPERLNNLDASYNRIAVLGMAYDSRIKNIKLDNNGLRTLSSSGIPDSVEVLNLSSNQIERVFPGTFENKTNLRLVNLQHNKLQNISKAAFALSFKFLTSCRFYFAGNPLECSCEMAWLRQTSVKEQMKIMDEEEAKCFHIYEKQILALSEVSDDNLLCSYKEFCEVKCPCCEFSICYCHSKCPVGCNCYRSFNASTNIVRCKALKGDERRKFNFRLIPNKATHIYLEKMNFPIIKRHSFLGLSALKQLHINASLVKRIEKQSFKSLKSLRLLDLSDNELIEFTGEEFNEETEITHLFLNNNRLRTLSHKIRENLRFLQFITLHSNKFKDLPEAVEEYGDSISKVSLGKNPFRCDCNDRFKMQSWLLDNLNRVVDAISIDCIENVTDAFLNNDTTVLSTQAPNRGPDVFAMNMLDFIQKANRSICIPEADGIFSIQGPSNYMFIFIGVLILLCIVTGLILFGRAVLRKTHAVMAQRRYTCPPSLNCSQITPGSSPVPLIHFDAFISYAKKDEELVIDALCRQLEYEEYLLCLLHRDGPAYNIKLHSVSDELINQMECSKSLILVLTQNFLDGEWKTLQIKTSHRLFAKSRGKKLIALLGDGIEPNQLDAELGQILRKNTCIRMRDPLFWNLLHSALPERISPSTCSGDSSQIYSDCYGTIVPSDIV